MHTPTTGQGPIIITTTFTSAEKVYNVKVDADLVITISNVHLGEIVGWISRKGMIEDLTTEAGPDLDDAMGRDAYEGFRQDLVVALCDEWTRRKQMHVEILAKTHGVIVCDLCNTSKPAKEIEVIRSCFGERYNYGCKACSPPVATAVARGTKAVTS